MMSQIKNISSDLMSCIRCEAMSYRVSGINSIIFLTYRCTSKCKTCTIWKRNKESVIELSWKEWLPVLLKLRDSGIKTVELFGGDALLRKDIIFEMIKFCSDNTIETFFPTNSILMDRETAQGLVEAGLGTIYFSLDNVGPENDHIRGVEGSFDKVKKAIEYIVEARNGAMVPKIIICSTISNMNADHFEQIVDFLKGYPIDAIYPRNVGEFSKKNITSSPINGIPPEPYFASSEDRPHLLDANQLVNFRNTVLRLKAKKSSSQPYINFRSIDMAPDNVFISGEYGIKRCLLCTTVIIVTPNGDIVPCPFFPEYGIGNLNQDDMKSIWGNKKHRTFITLQRQKKIKICDNCNMRPYYPTFFETVVYYGRQMKNLILPQRAQRTQR